MTTPKEMQQIEFGGAGGPEVIRMAVAAVPTPGPGKVLVEVVAYGINRPDCMQRSGAYPPPPGETKIPGLEISGRVVAVGDGVTSPKVGDEVCALVGSTGLYPYAVSGDRQVDARQFPRSSSYPEDPATGIAATALTFGLFADEVISADERPIIVRQGRAMGRPSRISIRLELGDGQIRGCWLGGSVEFSERSTV